MTQTRPARTQARYLGAVYGIDLLDHVSVMARTPRIVPDDYVGKTRQRGRAREHQHRDDQPWSDLIVGSSHVLWEGVCTEDELDAMERRFIRDVECRPRMNWLLNEDNPAQIPKWVQLEQRHERDDKQGRPRWIPPDERRPSGLLDLPTSARMAPARQVLLPRRWSPLQVKAGLWSAAWVSTTIIVGGLSARAAMFATWTSNALFGTIAALVLLLWSLAGAPFAGRQWRRLRSRGWKRWLR